MKSNPSHLEFELPSKGVKILEKLDCRKIQKVSQKDHLKKVLLFGSSLESDRENKDIDIAIEGLSPKDFYSYCGELLLILSQPVDVIDLSIRSKFTDLIKKEGFSLLSTVPLCSKFFQNEVDQSI